MRGSAWLVLILASASVVIAAVPPNHAPNHRSAPRFRPSPRDYRSTPVPKATTPYDLSPSDEAPLKKLPTAVTRLRQLLAPKIVDRVPEATQVHEEKVEAANGHPHGQLLPLVHVLPQVTILLELLLHLLHQVVPPSPHLLHHYHHSGAPLYPHGVHQHHAAHHHAGQHYHGAYQGGLLHTKPIGPFYGPGLYGVGSGNNVLGKGPFPAYKYEDNAKK